MTALITFTSSHAPSRDISNEYDYRQSRAKSEAGAFTNVASLSSIMTSTRSSDWRTGLHQRGLYFEGTVDGSDFNSVLEVHKRDTVSTFGTRSSRSCTQSSNDKAQDNSDTDVKQIKKV